MVNGAPSSTDNSSHQPMCELPSEPNILNVALTSLASAAPETEPGKQPWHPEELHTVQMQDNEIRPVMEWLEKSEARPPWETISPCSEVTKIYWAQWNSLRIKDGILYRLWETPEGDQTTWQIILPKALRPSVLHQLHNTPTAGHLAVAKTLSRVRERFYWAQCHQDVRDWCQNCDLCASRKGPPRRSRAPLGQYNVGAPMERLAIDVLGPLPVSDAGNKYLLIAADYFTKWPEAYPLPNQEAVTVAEVLVTEFVSRFGVPLELHSDQGRNFESAVFGEMCNLLGIKKTRTTPLHPQSDGMVERFNRTIEMQLAMFVEEHQRDCDSHIPLLLMSYRTATHSTTGCAPAKLMFGRNLRVPNDLLYPRPDGEHFESLTLYAKALQDKLDVVQTFARTHLKIASDRMKLYYDCRAEDSKLHTGDPVWLYNPQRKKGISPKLMRPWKSPFVVTKCLNDLVYRIQLGPRTKPKVVHRNRLWKYTGENPPSWLNELNAKRPSTTNTLSTDSRAIGFDSGTPLGAHNRDITNGPSDDEYTTEDATQPAAIPSASDETEPRRSHRQRKPPDRYGYATTRNGTTGVTRDV